MAYMYILMDPRTASFECGGYRLPHAPFYVGKGSGDRYKTKYRNKIAVAKIRKIESENLKPVALKFGELDDDTAFIMEKSFIQLFGRKTLGNGPLLNITDGGEGGSRPGGKRPDVSERLRGNKYNEGKSPWNKGLRYATTNPAASVECPRCHKIGHPGAMRRWHFENCSRKET